MRHCVSVNVCEVHIYSIWMGYNTSLHAFTCSSENVICTTSHNPPSYITCSSTRNYNTVSKLCIWTGHLH